VRSNGKKSEGVLVGFNESGGSARSDRVRVIGDRCEDARLGSLSGTFGCSLLCLLLLLPKTDFPRVCIKCDKPEDDAAKVLLSIWVPVRPVKPSEILTNIEMTARGSHRSFEEPFQRSGHCPRQTGLVGQGPTRFQSTRGTASPST
jgi:hypothetical protein